MDPRLETGYIAISQIEDEVHFDLLFSVFGARRATRGQLRLAIYRVWCQESAPEVHFELLFTVFGARGVKPLHKPS
eukprot:4687863-Heterocapsa_arctica.AAC.1